MNIYVYFLLCLAVLGVVNFSLNAFGVLSVFAAVAWTLGPSIGATIGILIASWYDSKKSPPPASALPKEVEKALQELEEVIMKPVVVSYTDYPRPVRRMAYWNPLFLSNLREKDVLRRYVACAVCFLFGAPLSVTKPARDRFGNELKGFVAVSLKKESPRGREMFFRVYRVYSKISGPFHRAHLYIRYGLPEKLSFGD